MQQILKYMVEVLMAVLPFLKKKGAKDIKEFSELITGQYEFLTEQLERVLKDYFEVSAKVREMHAEIFSLKEQLMEAAAERCKLMDCKDRM